MHSTAADSTDVTRSRDGADVRVVFAGGGKVLGTLALSADEATALRAALAAALGGAAPGDGG